MLICQLTRIAHDLLPFPGGRAGQSLFLDAEEQHLTNQDAAGGRQLADFPRELLMSTSLISAIM